MLRVSLKLCWLRLLPLPKVGDEYSISIDVNSLNSSGYPLIVLGLLA